MVVRKQVDVEALINKGGRVKDDERLSTKEWFIVNLRLPKSMLEEVDVAVDNRVGITRTGWILEAIHEKLRKNDGVS